jgi:hypothetical protein
LQLAFKGLRSVRAAPRAGLDARDEQERGCKLKKEVDSVSCHHGNVERVFFRLLLEK